MVYYYLCVFFYLSKVLFSGFLQFKGDFVDGRNNSKYCDGTLLMWHFFYCALNKDYVFFM